MADQQDEGQEKTEEPTARRLSKAREEGQIARSTEITIAASVISVAIYIFLFGGSLLGNVANIFARGLVFDSLAVLEPSVAAGRLGDAMIEALLSIVPILILTGVVVLACSGLIGGYNFSWKSLQPKASKFNPIAGLKRMFGIQALVNLGKSIAKATNRKFIRISLGGIRDEARSNSIKLMRKIKSGEREIYKIDLSTINGLKAAQMIVQSNDYIYIDFKYRYASAILQELTPWLSLLTTALLTYNIIAPN